MPSTKFVFFGPIEKKRPPWPLIGWDIFDFSSETTERSSIKLDRKQDLKALHQVGVFQVDRKKQNGLPGLWLAETFWTSPLKTLNGIQRNLKGSKIAMPSIKFVFFFWPIEKTKWLPWPLIGWDIFDFSSKTTERNSMKLDRKQDLKALYQVCVFQVDRKKKMAVPAYDLLRHFQLLLWNRWTELNKTWQKQYLNILYQACVFLGWSKKQYAPPLASDWLRHFRLLLWNRWTEFSETLQKAISQHPLPSLWFSGWSKKQYGHPGLWLAETYFDFSSETSERYSAKLDRKQDLKPLSYLAHDHFTTLCDQNILASQDLSHTLHDHSHSLHLFKGSHQVASE